MQLAMIRIVINIPPYISLPHLPQQSDSPKQLINNTTKILTPPTTHIAVLDLDTLSINFPVSIISLAKSSVGYLY